MFKGDFYHHFLQEAKEILSISQKQKAQKKINDVYLPNTFIRLGEDEEIKNVYWSDLSLNFKVDWPINLIITQDLLQVYRKIHKFLFPIRQIQIQLEQIWLQIPKRIKQQSKRIIDKAKIRSMWTFERILASLRNQMSMVINNLWTYLHSDVAQAVWTKLKNTLQNSIDFQEVINGVNKYIKSIQIMYFFYAPKIQHIMCDLIQKSKQFSNYFTYTFQFFAINKQTYNKVQDMETKFNGKLTQFYSQLQQISKLNNSQYVYHITKRMESCLNPNKNQKMI